MFTNRLTLISTEDHASAHDALPCAVGCSGTDSANDAFRFHANAATTRYAQSITRSSTAARSAGHPHPSAGRLGLPDRNGRWP